MAEPMPRLDVADRRRASSSSSARSCTSRPRSSWPSCRSWRAPSIQAPIACDIRAVLPRPRRAGGAASSALGADKLRLRRSRQDVSGPAPCRGPRRKTLQRGDGAWTPRRSRRWSRSSHPVIDRRRQPRARAGRSSARVSVGLPIHRSVPGAIWLPGAGTGKSMRWASPTPSPRRIEAATGGDKTTADRHLLPPSALGQLERRQAPHRASLRTCLLVSGRQRRMGGAGPLEGRRRGSPMAGLRLRQEQRRGYAGCCAEGRALSREVGVRLRQPASSRPRRRVCTMTKAVA